MTAIELPQQLINSLQQLATEQGSSIETIIEGALTDYLREQRHRLLLQEMEHFREQLEIRLYSSLKDEFVGPFPAILDTGSDATLVPLAPLLTIGAEETAPGWMVGITGDRQPVSLYFVDAYIGNLALPGIRVIGNTSSQEIILGRDVLNKLPIFLDGIQQQTTLLDDSAASRLRSH